MGTRGPVPKHPDHRAGHRSAEELHVDVAPSFGPFPAPPPDPNWHETARKYYESFAVSGQRQWFEPSDWRTLWVLTENLSRQLSPRPIVISGGKGLPDTIEWITQPMSGSEISSFLKGCSSLLATVGDRRRMSVELEQGEKKDTAADSNIISLLERLGG